MIRATTSVFAASLHRAALAIPAFGRLCRKASADMFGSVMPTPTSANNDARRQSAQAESARQIAHLIQSRTLLLAEKEIVAAERKRARSQRKQVSSFDARLQAINAELLKIGGN